MPKLSTAEILRMMSAGQAIKGIEVHEPIVAVGTRFTNPVYISGTRFKAPVALSACTFERGAVFHNTTFESTADFRSSHFAGQAYFWRGRFVGNAHFDDIVVYPGVERMGSIDPGEFNLCWAHFRTGASLVRARLNGPARFWRTLFFGDVRMDQALFGNLAVFMGLEHEVSVDLFTLGGVTAFEVLGAADLIRPDPETIGRLDDGRELPQFAQLNVRSADELQLRLAATTLPPESRAAIQHAFEDEARPMFASDRHASLCGVEVPSPGQIQFIDMDMRFCRLLGTPLAGARLSNVRWPRRSLMLGTVQRYATADEQGDPPHPHALWALQRLYRELAANYKQQQDLVAARAFRIAEREVVRKQQPLVPRALSATYRQLAVYGESPEVALFWLLLFVFVLFPSLFMLAGLLQEGVSNWRALLLQSMVRSLEVSTFLNDSKEELPLLPRLTAGIERIVVATQVTFFAITLKRLFPR